MACLSRAQDGGHSVLVDMRPFLTERGPRGELDPLFGPEAVAIERGEVSAKVSVLRHRDGYIDVAFSDHEYNIASPKRECADSFELLRSYIAAPANQRNILLDAGDLLLVANRFCLHGREAFSNGPLGVRHFVRAWYRGRVPASQAFEGFAASW
jgi:hypothetical protein